MKIHVWTEIGAVAQSELLKRPHLANQPKVRERVAEIIATVKIGGDEALQSYTKIFDGVDQTLARVSSREFSNAFAEVSKKSKNAIAMAQTQIERFHRAAQSKNISVEQFPGLICRREARAIASVGFYIPGGTAPLPSTVLMLAVPARLAGCRTMVLCSPPRHDGTLDPHILFTAQLCGIENIFKVGGAQAIAAMAYGTKSVPKVDKIFGPGNTYVSEAKAQVGSDPDGAAIDMIAGPSEVLVIADASANAGFVASDLLSQAEHGKDSQVVLLATDEDILSETLREIEIQLATLPRREIAQACLAQSRFVRVDSLDRAIEISNRYAPEHLILHVGESDTERLAEKIVNAGSVFLGKWSPEAMGDYASGTNHVLPTYGLARATSGVSVDSFTKFITFQTFTAEGLRQLGPTVEHLAELEGLHGHARAVRRRLTELGA